MTKEFTNVIVKCIEFEKKHKIIVKVIEAAATGVCLLSKGKTWYKDKARIDFVDKLMEQQNLDK